MVALSIEKASQESASILARWFLLGEQAVEQLQSPKGANLDLLQWESRDNFVPPDEAGLVPGIEWADVRFDTKGDQVGDKASQRLFVSHRHAPVCLRISQLIASLPRQVAEGAITKAQSGDVACPVVVGDGQATSPD
jgi:hypothetical protein